MPEHLADVAREAGSVGAVLVTHDHPDHAPGAIPFARLVGAPVYAFRLMGATKLSAGQRVRAGDLDLTAIHTPGHTSDHVAFFEPGSGALFTGDTVLGRGTSFIDLPDGDLVQYLRSLRRLGDLGARSIYPGHGPAVLHARDKLVEYLAHRDEREAQIVSVLAEGPRTIAEMVEVIYAITGRRCTSRGAVGAGASREAGPRGASGTDRQGRRGDLDGLDAENLRALRAPGQGEGPLLRFMHPAMLQSDG